MRWKRWLKILGVVLLLYVAGSAFGAWLVTHPPGAAADPAAIHDPFGAGVEVREVTIAGTPELAAWYRPGQGGAVVLLHGYRESRATMRELAALLAHRTPYALLVPDLRGCGNSEAAATSIGILERDDAARALDYLAQVEGVRASRTVVIGFSMGGVAALQLAAERELAGLIVLSPYTSLERAVDVRTRHFSGLPARPLFVPAMWFIGWICGDDVFAVDLVEVAGRSRAKQVLVLSEDDDWRAPRADAERIASALRSPVEVVSGTAHRILWGEHAETMRARCAQAVTAWLR